jgi:hypothetical protein
MNTESILARPNCTIATFYRTPLGPSMPVKAAPKTCHYWWQLLQCSEGVQLFIHILNVAQNAVFSKSC